MTTETNSEYQKVLKFAEQGNHQQALNGINKFLDKEPENPEMLNDAGAILFCLDRFDEAIEHFEKAKRINGDSAEILWNLSEAYLCVGKAEQANELFDDMEKKGVLSADVLNRAANVFLNEGKSAGALKMLNRSLQISPEQEIIKKMIEVVSSQLDKQDTNQN